MDRERLGRVLGRGTRLAARTALEAVDAATAPGPVSRLRPAGVAKDQKPARGLPAPATVVRTLGPAMTAARKGVALPLRRATRALWHELTGTFFALFALSFGLGAWRTRANALSKLPADRYHLYAFCALMLLFGYFSISSFLRARRQSAR